MFSASFSLILSKWGGSTIYTHTQNKKVHLHNFSHCSSVTLFVFTDKIEDHHDNELSFSVLDNFTAEWLHTFISAVFIPMIVYLRMTYSYNTPSYLAGVNRCGGECCLAQGDGGPQEVSGSSLVLTGLQLQFLPWQHRLIARSITRRREELKLPMTTPKEKTHPTVWHDRRRNEKKTWSRRRHWVAVGMIMILNLKSKETFCTSANPVSYLAGTLVTWLLHWMCAVKHHMKSL